MLTLTSPHETRAHRWPAGAKLAGLVAFSVGLFALNIPAAAGALALVAAGAWALGFLGAWAGLLRMLWPVALVLLAWHGWSGTWGAGVLAVLRMAAAVGAANLLTMTTRLSDLQEVVLWLLRPLSPILSTRAVALSFALVLRFIPVVLQRWTDLSLAYRARSPRRPGWRIAAPAVLAALDDAEHVAEALRARGGAG